MLKQEMLALADLLGVLPTENLDKIVRAKEMMHLGMKCPCDALNPERYCISPLCSKDIETKGTCHCKCWKRKED